MSEVDLSVVVTVHDESVVCGPTMRSADAAVEQARAVGLRVETIVAMDAPSEETVSYFAAPHFDHWDRRRFEERDLGGVRNAVISGVKGRMVAFLDADDLFSENWLTEAVRCSDAAAGRGERVIVHPELNVFFDGARSVLVNIDQDSPLFTPHLAYFRNYYDALCLAPREAFEEVPYERVDLDKGIGFEDWQWAIETMAEGWNHRVAKDTIIFKRRRDVSLLSASRSAILRRVDPLAVDAVRELGKATSRSHP